MVKGITHILTNNAAVQNLVGRNKANTKYKAYPGICGEPEKFPYSIVRQTGKTPVGECKDGQGSTYDYSYDVFSYHVNYEEAEAIDAAVVNALQGTSGTHNSVVFTEDIRHINTVDGDYVAEFKLHVKVSSFQATVEE